MQTAIAWFVNSDKDEAISKYMSDHQHDQNANELRTYFQNVINWIELTFTTYRKEMKGIDWGNLYNSFKDTQFNTDEIETEVEMLMKDEDVENKKGIYPFIHTRQEKHLNIGKFSDNMKREAYETQS